jgi:hypothetical protein
MQDSTNTTNSSYAHDITWNSLFHHQPMHQHHSGYKFMLTKQQRQRGISHYGSAERLRAALSRAVTSKLIATSQSAVLPAEHEALISVVGCKTLPACQGWSAVTHIRQGTFNKQQQAMSASVSCPSWVPA